MIPLPDRARQATLSSISPSEARLALPRRTGEAGFVARRGQAKPAPRRRGLSLVEILFAMAIFALLLVTMTVLFRTGLSQMTTTSAQTQNVLLARLALQTMLAEFRQAQVLGLPATGTSTDRLRFVRAHPDPSVTDGFEVKYYLNKATLMRKTWVRLSDGSEPSNDNATVEAVYGGILGITVTAPATSPPQVHIDIRADTSGTASPLTVSLTGLSAERLTP